MNMKICPNTEEVKIPLHISVCLLTPSILRHIFILRFEYD
ncbi:hypothetical protein E2C01_046505 [Portunus trituberculatus]|uniref:Uncharacterized protein n=1 Tax=Portunus trituberculatus TaxID=210409 RepID=A0A5B7FY31_PORTR|nr:hypothetical protein [Portunus trituberculatus]